MELLKDLELVEVTYENSNKKAVMTFLDEEHGEIRIVNFNKQSYQDGQYIDDAEKEEKVNKWCQELFNTDFKGLANCVGIRKDVYVYEGFNSLFEVEMVNKFTKDDLGQIINTTIKEIIVDDFFIKIRYEYEGAIYESKQTYGKYMESMHKWFKDPNKKEKEFKKFYDKYGVTVDDREKIIGHQIIVEVKSAFGKHFYGDIKPFPKKKRG